jgi:hypothetical protein
MVKQLENYISSLSKDELEELAREDGVELDKRLTKDKLVKQVADIDSPAEVVNEVVTDVESDEERRQRLRNLNI